MGRDDGRGGVPVVVEVDVAAPGDTVYELVSDVGRMGEWSPECERCEWVGGAERAALGARFRGHNRIGARRWSTVSTVVAADRGRAFGFRTSALGAARRGDRAGAQREARPAAPRRHRAP